MAFFDPRPGLNDLLFGSVPETTDSQQVNSANNVQDIIDPPEQGSYSRQMLKWRVPMFGWITMFLNPENIQIQEEKDIGAKRTKAGFIMQYAGEKLTQITLRGTTGSAGMEGINILRTIYRSEQIAFDQIANELDRTGPLAEFMQLTRGTTGAGFISDQLFGDRTFDVALNVLSQPFPTLASLAANVELFFQGELYRGYFKSFSVDENSSTNGIFSYTINFTAYARQGVRRNFMPWHRQPFNPMGASAGKANPLSYTSPPSVITSDLTGILENVVEKVDRGSDRIFGNRSTSTASGSLGRSLEEYDLRG